MAGKRTRVKFIAAEIESTYGSAATIGATDVIVPIECTITPLQADVVERELVKDFYSANQQLLANLRVVVNITVEATGSGDKDTAPRYGRLFQACGLEETVNSGTSVVYKPSSDNHKSVTLHYIIDGILHQVTGARGTFTFEAEVGSIPRFVFEFTGIYNDVSAQAIPTNTPGDQASALVFKNDNVTNTNFIDSGVLFQSINIDCGNQVEYRELVGSSGKEVLITDRGVLGNVNIQLPELSQVDYFAKAKTDGTALGAFSFTHGTAEGNKVAFSSTKVDIGQPNYGDLQGIAMLELPYTLIASSASGSNTVTDEFELTFS